MKNLEKKAIKKYAISFLLNRKEKRMIEKVFCFKDLYYLTQYALSDISDEEVVAKFNYLAKNIKNNTMRDKYKKQVLSIVDKMSNVDDDINQKIFDKCFYVEDTMKKIWSNTSLY
ncbi:Uncharacterised protein (plasmid) [Mesomycoplasma conjunctivae]|nr:Uncharacterised protein [Mesomycoplasma conjunctivae]